MAEPRLFKYSIVTPEKIKIEGKAEFMALPGLDGEFGILHNRSPLLVRLSPGLVRIRLDNQEKWYFVGGGFAQVLSNQVTILTPRAASREEIQPDDAQAAKERARNMAVVDDASERKLHDAYAEVHALDRFAARSDV